MLKLLSVTRLSLVRYSIGLLCIAVALPFLWPGLASNLFASGIGEDMFMPHGHCYLWMPSLVVLHVSADSVIGISYVVISLTLAYLIYCARRDIPFHWIFLAFGLFIIACGATHFMEVITLWKPTYWLSGYIKLITAAASLATAVVLPAIVPRALLLARGSKISEQYRLNLEAANRKLEKELTERKRAEAALRETNQTLQALFQASPLAIYGIDGDGKVLIWNQAAERIFGWSEQEVIGRPLPFISEDKQEEIRLLRERVMRGEVFTNFEVRRQTKNGATIDVSISTAALRDAQGEINGVIAITADITKRKRAEEALQASESELRALFAAMTDVIFVFDAEGRYLKIATTNSALLYKPSAEILGKTISEVFPPDQADFFMDSIRRALETAQPVNIEYSLDIDNQKLWFAGIASPMSEDRVVFVARDITERKRAEEKLRQSEEWLRAIFEASRDCIVVVDDGVMIYVNKSCTELLGCDDPKDVIGKDISTVLPPDEAERLAEFGRRRLRGEPVPTVYEFRGMRKDGTLGEVEAAVSTSVVAGKTYIIAVIRDISERKRAAEALRKTEEQLRQSYRLKAIGQLAGGIAHDFNNLLTVITGYSNLLLKHFNEDTPLRQRLTAIKNAADRAASLTHQLLAFSRKQMLQPRILDINTVVTDVSKMLLRLIGEDVELVMSLKQEVGRINADPGQIEQVLMNLTVNARDAMPQGGRIVIETANVLLDETYTKTHPQVTPGHYVRLTVSDTGSGMDAETQKHIFEPFFTTKAVGRGTGLGLSTVYGIIKQSGGYIWVYSEPGAGTTFKIYLPRVEADVESPKEIIERDETPKGTETILLVEDEAIVRTLARDILNDQGYKVLEATNGEDAIRLSQEYGGQIHVMITDVVMPRMGGRKLAEAMKQLRPEMRVIYMSGYTDDAIVHHGVLDKDAPFLEKPFAPDALTRKLHEVLNSET